MVDTRLVVVRALNYLRSVHLPSYVALRLLLDSVQKEKFVGVIDALVDQVTIRKVARLLNIKRFKSKDEEEYRYRNYSVPSPTTALADCYAIAVLQNADILVRKDSVFSYRPPIEHGYTRSFEHFSLGYKERNRAVEAALNQHGVSAVVADLRNFYPSVDAPMVLARLVERMTVSPKVSKREIAVVTASARRCFSSPDENGRVGLRIGPEMSHVLADLALEQVDKDLSQAFGSNYFRYVDDIVIVVPTDSAARYSAELSDCLSRAGFSRNTEKDAVVGSEEWGGHKTVGIAGGLSGDSLAQFKFRAKMFLAKNPEQLDSLRASLNVEGIFLPLDQLLQGTFDLGWRARVVQFVVRGWWVALRYWFDSVGNVVQHAIECRHILLSDVESVMSTRFPTGSSSVDRKWKVQRARFVVNRALYFADNMLLHRIREFASAVPELAETEAVCGALLGDFSRLIYMPGNAVSAAAQLLSLRDVENRNEFSLSNAALDSGILADVVAHFAIRGVSISFALRSSLDSDEAGVLTFALGMKYQDDIVRGALGYGPEVAAIGMNYPLSARTRAASTRFSSAEDVVFDALSLSTAYGS